ncbi:hypothetical protein J8F10_35025 [Gemmata sp. G18]|uniref:Uncharacterized protein n=1 Tax=Gemmata palustris TaxID=2822762 RepID=A0ABS5C3J7_9BACT|nr:hypothetical protein [Gemmata palustris]MBP3960468.1 hypothetical protein [Gemmata palustris]
MSLLWTDGDRHIPCDYRIYNKDADARTKNDHFGDMIRGAPGASSPGASCSTGGTAAWII